jgi:hypothetical protein
LAKNTWAKILGAFIPNSSGHPEGRFCSHSLSAPLISLIVHRALTRRQNAKKVSEKPQKRVSQQKISNLAQDD